MSPPIPLVYPAALLRSPPPRRSGAAIVATPRASSRSALPPLGGHRLLLSGSSTSAYTRAEDKARAAQREKRDALFHGDTRVPVSDTWADHVQAKSPK